MTGDHLPIRGLAVPGLNPSARAILMALDSSVLPSEPTTDTANCGTTCTADTATCSWPQGTTPSGSQPRRPSYICSGSEPHCRTSQHARLQPGAFAERPLCTDCLLRLLRTAHGSPCRATRYGRQSRRHPATTLASELHYRTALRTHCCCPPVHVWPGPSTLTTKENIATRTPNVYLSGHRFWWS